MVVGGVVIEIGVAPDAVIDDCTLEDDVDDTFISQDRS